MTDLLFKVTGPDGQSCHGGVGVWPAPPAWRVADDGLYLSPIDAVTCWARKGSHLWVAQAGAPVTRLACKVVTTRARLVEHIGVWRGRGSIRLWAGAWAAHMMMMHPGDPEALDAAELATACHHGIAPTSDFIVRMLHLEPTYGCAAPALVRGLSAPPRATILRQLAAPIRRRGITAAGGAGLVVRGS